MIRLVNWGMSLVRMVLRALSAMLLAMPKPRCCSSEVKLEIRIHRVNKAMKTLINKMTRVVEMKILFLRLLSRRRAINLSTIQTARSRKR